LDLRLMRFAYGVADKWPPNPGRPSENYSDQSPVRHYQALPFLFLSGKFQGKSRF
jgi:hypothetical protein